MPNKLFSYRKNHDKHKKTYERNIMEITQYLDSLPSNTIAESEVPAIEKKQLGEYLRNIRKAKGWTITEAAKKASIATSSLSKIENNLMSPTYDLLIKLANGYQVDLASFFQTKAKAKSTARMSVTRKGETSEHSTPDYNHHVHATGLSNKQMMPFITDINPKTDREVELSAHAGEEFVYVIAGEITFFTEYYQPVILHAGDSLYIDSNMKHGAISNLETSSKVIWMASNI